VVGQGAAQIGEVRFEVGDRPPGDARHRVRHDESVVRSPDPPARHELDHDPIAEPSARLGEVTFVPGGGEAAGA